MAEETKTPKEVADELWLSMNEDLAKSIAAEVYQPLLDEIKRLEKRVEALEKESFRQSLYINDDQ